MFRSKKKQEPTKLDEAIIDVYDRMKDVSPDSKEYTKLLKQLERLVGLKTNERRAPVSSDTVAIVVANLIGIVIIVGYERGHVVVSKAFGLLLKKKA